MTTSQKYCIKFKWYLFYLGGGIGTFRPLSIKFISKTIKDGGNPLTYYWKFSTQSIQEQQKKGHQYWVQNKTPIYLSHMLNFWIKAPLIPLFETNNKKCSWPMINCIKIAWKFKKKLITRPLLLYLNGNSHIIM